MGYANLNGYVPSTIETIINSIMEGLNEQFGTDYTAETFTGTDFYKYSYAIAQRIQENEVRTGEIFAKLQDYFNTTNEEISVPEVTPNGVIAAFAEIDYVVSVKPMIDADAGKIYICVDVDDDADDFDDQKLLICQKIRELNVAGVVSQGSESENLSLTNGQLFDFKFVLPDITEVLLKLTVTLSRNNQGVIDSPEDQKLRLLANIAAEYALGKDFEPERYFDVEDAPWASDILLEYSVDAGMNWSTDVYEADYDELFSILLENVELIEE